MAKEIVHLHAHTHFSILDGGSQIEPSVRAAKEMGMPALAVTEHGNMYSAVPFYTAAKKAGIKPILGAELYVSKRSRHDKEKEDRDPWHLIVLAKDNEGYENLQKLISYAWLEGFYYHPQVDKELLHRYGKGLIGLSGCIGSELPKAIIGEASESALEQIIDEHIEIFGSGNYFLELQNHGIPEENVVRAKLAELSRNYGIPLVATNDSHYIAKEDAESHDLLLCLQTRSKHSDEKRFKLSGPEYYLKTAEEMTELFSEFGEEPLTNTVKIAEMCNVEMDLANENHMPRFTPRPDLSNDAYLRRLCYKGAELRYGLPLSKEVIDRLETELGVITSIDGFTDYFLITWDIVKTARRAGKPVGPGRGSAAGSLVVYCLGITQVDPIKYNLFFERFLNAERISAPDIDIDFCPGDREWIIEKLGEKYGKDNVAQIITFGTLGAKASIRAVGSVLEIPQYQINKMAKLVPIVPGITLEKALLQSPELRALCEDPQNPWAAEIMRHAKRIEGSVRNYGTHASGVVVSPEPLINLLPVQKNKDSNVLLAAQDGKTINKRNLLKIDILGLANLPVIANTVELVQKTRGEKIDIYNLPETDAATFKLLCEGDTLGVFQMEGGGAKRTLVDVHPQSISEIGIATALNRPGPIQGGIPESYMRRRTGKEAPHAFLPQMEASLKETLGTMVYQDQVMSVAKEVAGYTMGQADILRNAMGKKDAAQMAEQKVIFIAGAAENGVSQGQAEELFDLMARFAEYGFNKAHALSYGVLAYQTAYLKANYPIEFMTSLLTYKASDFDKLGNTIYDCRARGIEVLPPDINRSEADFAIGDLENKTIYYGLANIKHVSSKTAELLITERAAAGPFTDIPNLLARVPIASKSDLESFIMSGACDSFGERTTLLAQVPEFIKFAKNAKEDAQRIAAGRPPVKRRPTEKKPIEVTPVGLQERLGWERELCSASLSAHPLDEIKDLVAARRHIDLSLSDCNSTHNEQKVSALVVIQSFERKIGKKNNVFANLKLEDSTGICEGRMFARDLEALKMDLKPGDIVLVKAKVDAPIPEIEEEDGMGFEAPDKGTLLVQEVFPLEQVQKAFQKKLNQGWAPPGAQKVYAGIE